MFRFACPQCGAKYTVDDTRRGKSTRCKRCRTKFVIPLPDPPPAPTPNPDFSLLAAPPPPEPPPGVDIAPCPGCQVRLTVSQTDLGSNVSCPHCHTVFAAVRPGAILPQTRVMDAEIVAPPAWPEPPAPQPVKRSRAARVGGRRTVASVGVLSAAKMAGAMSFVGGLLVSLIYGFFALILYFLGASAGGDIRGLIGIGMLYVICSLLVYPFVLGVSGFIGGAIGALIYNLLAAMIGGVEVELE